MLVRVKPTLVHVYAGVVVPFPDKRPQETLAPMYKMQARGSQGDVYLYGIIGETFFGTGVTAKQFSDDLKALGSVTSLDIRINSEGGNVFEGKAMYNLLMEHPAKKTVHIDGLAASIASVVAMAGDEIVMGEGTFMMIHNAWGFAMGGAAEMRRQADLLDSMSESLLDVYTAKTKKEKESIKAWMDEETWMNAADSVANGFAHKVRENAQIAACVMLPDIFAKLPTSIHPRQIEARSIAQRIALTTKSEKLKNYLR